MRSFTLINLLLFQAAWFSAALAGGFAIWLMLLLLAVHFRLTPSRFNDVRLLPLAAIGWIADLLLQQSGIVNFGQSAPLWLLLLWCHLVLCFNHGLRWLARLSLPVQALIGAFGASSSYFAGLKFGVLSSQLQPLWFIASYAAVWLLLLPLLCFLAQRLTQPLAAEVAIGGSHD